MGKEAIAGANLNATATADATVNAEESKGLIAPTTDLNVNDIPVIDGEDLKAVSFNAGLNVSLLNSDINALIEKSDTKTKLLVYAKPEEIRPATIAALTELLSSYGLKLDSNALDHILGLFGMHSENLSIELSRLFFYTELSGTTNPPTEDKSKTEFAFKITITNKPSVSTMSLFKINSLSFAVWKTERPNVLKSLNLTSIAALLEGIA